VEGSAAGRHGTGKEISSGPEGHRQIGGRRTLRDVADESGTFAGRGASRGRVFDRQHEGGRQVHLSPIPRRES